MWEPDVDRVIASLRSTAVNRYRIDLAHGVFQSDPKVPGDHEAMLEALERLQRSGLLGTRGPS